MLIGQSKERCKGINFKFSFPNSLCRILSMSCQVNRNSKKEYFGFIIQVKVSFHFGCFELFEGVRIRIRHDEFSLGIHKPSSQRLNFGAVLGDFHIR